MSKKQDFINYVEELMKAVDDSSVVMNENAKIYWEAFKGTDSPDKPLFTDTGKMILKYLQKNPAGSMWRAKDIAEGLLISSRSVSGAMRKLVADGYIEKIGQDPSVYSLTEEARKMIIE